MQTSDRCAFRFRLWLWRHDPVEIETWYDGLEDTSPRRRFASEWAQEALTNLANLRAIFGIPPEDEQDWQVVGEATVTGQYDYWGEYDEHVAIQKFEKAPVPERPITIIPVASPDEEDS